MFLTQIINGQVTELALCEACARAKGLFDPQSLTFAEKFFPEELKSKMDNIIRELMEKNQAPVGAHVGETPHDPLTQCPVCHFTLADYRRTNHLGCPDCYHTFASEIAQSEISPSGESTPKHPIQSPQLSGGAELNNNSRRLLKLRTTKWLQICVINSK